MRETTKTRQRRITHKKTRRTRIARGVEESLSPIVNPNVIVKTKAIADKNNTISKNVVSVAAVEAINPKIYRFEKKSLFSEFKSNKAFRDAIMSCAYFYHQGKICLYHPDVFTKTVDGIKVAEVVDQKPQDYLMSHLESLVVTTRLHVRRRGNVLHKIHKQKNEQSWRNRTNDGSLKDACVYHAKKYSEKAYNEGKQYSETFVHIFDLVKGFIYGGQVGGPNDTFGVFLTNLMSERKLTVKDLADMTDIPERTITRMRSEEGYRPSIEYLIACCIVMKLPPWDSDTLFELAGIVLRPNNKKERCYIVLLHVFFKYGSIKMCDDVLDEVGLTKLSSIINANKKNK